MPIEIEKDGFAREIGSNTIVNENDWNEEASFGHCPACDSLGMEIVSSVEDPSTTFSCSDSECYTDYLDSQPAIEGNIVGTQRLPTTWIDKKTDEWRKKETEDEISWNWTHFSEEYCIEHELD